ncbi:helix-turn-helix domain-containing protein [Actinoplanes lobatus]|uniref:HTH cro/C1-type domain-containing protein n=1 Tax=Actinoplanes lobatus TaxID=113568 RepID=A0A7W7HRD9_9ACTN|nr:helix-turn-helix transcriptional regulator [Actinoplanes lobatus]MBB4755315.1 hypothetical protein [Actinoplanes lobatus]GIE46188.1 hypothetical protein Alo02nite_90860 [Actinoplanes lobatus]
MTIEKPRAYRLRSYHDLLTVLVGIRTARKISIKEWSRVAGHDRSEITNWTARRREMRASVIWALANALGYDIALIPRQPEEQP